MPWSRSPWNFFRPIIEEHAACLTPLETRCLHAPRSTGVARDSELLSDLWVGIVGIELKLDRQPTILAR
jgi:hypothetical protein